ncbi:MAG: thioredoxin family protein [Kiritimatiellia bacterium]|jgi:protein disulfide-isomerase|nr:thioredoxin family protein [Kiritimatiellia bacterium]MDP6631190.1 thioredoxin family protein [Kiritimatiellia bacterium]MDP6809788.1 thioredoxin family protein [Kiritimatiellia bacterium]MDP7025102.1 thioredoxin family protein [Kiritimatiellia bacterium]
MYKLMSVALVALTTMVTITSAAPEAEAGGHAGWMTDFEAAKKLAAEKKRPILADFSGSDWCGWCIKLDKEVFSKKPFKAYAKQNVVLFLADFPSRTEQPAKLKAQNEKLAKTYGVRGFPTVLLLDAKAKVIGRTGYQAGGPEAYVKHIKELLAKAKAKPAASAN